MIHVLTLVKVNGHTSFRYKLDISGSRDKGQGFWNVKVPCDLLGCEPLAVVSGLLLLLFSFLLLLYLLLIGLASEVATQASHFSGPHSASHTGSGFILKN